MEEKLPQTDAAAEFWMVVYSRQLWLGRIAWLKHGSTRRISLSKTLNKMTTAINALYQDYPHKT